MSRNVDREDVLSFVTEAKGYLPEIEMGILNFATDPSRGDDIFEAFRLTHTIKGGSSMVGLSCLSHIAYYQEEVLEDLATGRATISREVEDLLSALMAILDLYLDSLLRGNSEGPGLLSEATVVYRRYRGLPEHEDESAIAQVLSEAEAADREVVLVDSQAEAYGEPDGFDDDEDDAPAIIDASAAFDDTLTEYQEPLDAEATILDARPWLSQDDIEADAEPSLRDEADADEPDVLRAPVAENDSDHEFVTCANDHEPEAESGSLIEALATPEAEPEAVEAVAEAEVEPASVRLEAVAPQEAEPTSADEFFALSGAPAPQASYDPSHSYSYEFVSAHAADPSADGLPSDATPEAVAEAPADSQADEAQVGLFAGFDAEAAPVAEAPAEVVAEEFASEVASEEFASEVVAEAPVELSAEAAPVEPEVGSAFDDELKAAEAGSEAHEVERFETPWEAFRSQSDAFIASASPDPDANAEVVEMIQYADESDPIVGHVNETVVFVEPGHSSDGIASPAFQPESVSSVDFAAAQVPDEPEVVAASESIAAVHPLFDDDMVGEGFAFDDCDVSAEILELALPDGISASGLLSGLDDPSAAFEEPLAQLGEPPAAEEIHAEAGAEVVAEAAEVAATIEPDAPEITLNAAELQAEHDAAELQAEHEVVAEGHGIIEQVADHYLDELDAILGESVKTENNVLLSEAPADAALLASLHTSDADDFGSDLLDLVESMDSNAISRLLDDDLKIHTGSVDGEHVEVFQLEARDHIQKIVARLSDFRHNPDDIAGLSDARATLHTLKGGAGAVGMVAVAVSAHRIEDLLESLIKGSSAPSEGDLARLFSSIDILEDLLEGRLSDEDAYQTLEVLLEDNDPSMSDPSFGASAPPSKPAHVSAFAPGSSVPAIDLDDMGSVPTEVLEIFAQEAEDHIKNIYATLGDLEREPANQSMLQSVRRSAHTLKGAAGAVKLRAVTQLAHRMEDLLDHLYDNDQPLTEEVRALLFETTDVLDDLTENNYDRESMRATILGLFGRYDGYFTHSASQSQAGEPAHPHAAAPLVSAPTYAPASIPMPSLAPAAHAVPAEPVGPAFTLTPLAASARPTNEIEAEGLKVPAAPAYRPTGTRRKAAQAPKRTGEVLRVPIERIDELVRLVSELVINRTGFEQRMLEMAKTLDEHRRTIARLKQVSSDLETQYETRALAGRRFGELLGGGNGAHNGDGASAGNNVPHNRLQQFFLNPARDEFDDLEFDRYTKFHLLSRSLAETTSDLQTLDSELHNLTGDYDTLLTRQGRLSREIQDKLMRVRMVPLATLTTSLHRAVRVVAQQQNKLVDLVLEGEHTELDKTVLEEMSDAFLHLLRNAVDHGVEPSSVRLVRGKPERATIKVRASYQGTQVVIQVEDDGGGIDPENLRASAVRGGYLSPEDAARLSPQDLFQLIFLPGFSTASEISEISGRGVGMEIVKVKVHKLKGTVEVDSTVGQGTIFTIRLPMTLAITRALMVRCNNESFAIPAQSVSQILRVDRREIEKIGHEPVIRLGGKVYPLVRLGDVLALRQPPDESRNMLPVLVVDAGPRQVTVVVDQIEASREVVVKTLGSHLRRVKGMIGATLLGDGTVIPILNIVELVAETKFDARGAAVLPARPAAGAAPAKPDDPWSILIVDDSVSVRRVVANMVKGEGWTPVVAKDGLDAVEVLQGLERAPDLVLLDIEMPRMDGYELLGRLRSQPAYRDLPVVMVTSRAGDKHRKKAMELGATDYVVKPYQDEAMIALIHLLVSRRRGLVMV